MNFASRAAQEQDNFFSRSGPSLPHRDIRITDFNRGYLLERLQKESHLSGLESYRAAEKGFSAPQNKQQEKALDKKGGFSFYFIPVLVIILFNAYTWQSTQVERLRVQIGQVKTKIRKEIIRNNELRLKLAQKLSFKEVERIAKEKWGLESHLNLDFKLRQKRANRIVYLELGK